MNPWLNGIVGNWEFSGTGRLQVRDFRLERACGWSGMTEDELQKAFKIRDGATATAATLTVFSLPQDIIDNTRRAYNTDPTSATGYGADGTADRPLHRAGEHARLHRRSTRATAARRSRSASAARCSRASTCASRSASRSARSANFELRASKLLNVFDNVNFNPTFDVTPAAGSTTRSRLRAATPTSTRRSIRAAGSGSWCGG